VGYSIESPGGALSSGTLQFQPGEMVKYIPSGIASPQSHTALRVALGTPVNGEITGLAEAWFINSPTSAPPVTSTLLARGANWKYLDTGVNAGTAWREPGFDDTTWASGLAELGYGDGDEATTVSFGPNSSTKYITTYFRRAFNVTDPSVFSSVSMWLLRDDAGVVYLNGSEVFRSPNLPTGTISYNTLAPGSAPPDDTVDIASLNTSVLQTGNNVAAVEIHQQALNSSDLSFNFEVLGVGTPSRPTLAFEAFGDRYLLHWGDPGFVLEEAETITGPWTVRSATSPSLVSPTETSLFFRLKR
jgi:hypothetical protein